MAAKLPTGCRYCGGRPLSVEHALSGHLAELIPAPESLVAERLTIQHEEQQLLSSWAPRSVAHVQVRDFCEPCNNGWMNDLDHGVKQEFGDLVLGRDLTLSGAQAATWSSWVFKQYLSYQPAYPEDLSAPADFTDFYEVRQPGGGVQVYLGLGENLPWPHLHARRPLWSSDALTGDNRRCTFVVWIAVYGQLVIHVVHSRAPEFEPSDPPGLARVWPNPEGVRSDSLPRLDVRAVAELVKVAPVVQRCGIDLVQ